MPSPLTLLLVEDDANTRRLWREALKSLMDRVVEASDGLEGLQAWERYRPDLIVTDLKMPVLDGLSFVGRVLAQSPLTPVIMITGHGEIASAVEAMRLGVSDYLTKPIALDALVRRVRETVEARVLPRRALHATQFLPAGGEDVLVTVSARMRTVLETIVMVRRDRSNVLIQGETGTGKEVAARAVHFGGPNPDLPFVAVNCAGIPEGVLESQLFGHVKGAFTGATSDSPGLFLAASPGTLFLDEITEMTPRLQSKLLRIVQEQEVLPVGGTEPVKVDVRLISATNRPLGEALAGGSFREDLFYRLAVVPILLPPLRERRDDILVLIAYFNSRFARKHGGPEKVFTPAALARLSSHAWPGNVRELRNVVERLYATCPDATIDERQLKQYGLPAATPVASRADLPSWDDVERDLILRALTATQGNRSEAAKLLRIDRKRLYRKIKKHGLDPDGPPEEDGE